MATWENNFKNTLIEEECHISINEEIVNKNDN